MSERASRIIEPYTRDDVSRFFNLATSLVRESEIDEDGHRFFEDYIGDLQSIEVTVTTKIKSKKKMDDPIVTVNLLEGQNEEGGFSGELMRSYNLYRGGKIASSLEMFFYGKEPAIPYRIKRDEFKRVRRWRDRRKIFALDQKAMEVSRAELSGVMEIMQSLVFSRFTEEKTDWDNFI